VTADRFRVLVSRVLIVGVTTSAILIGLGFALSLFVGWQGSLLGAATATGSPTDFGGLAEALLAVRPVGLVQAGLVVLIATPVVRVMASVAAFALEGDRLYTVITLAVLAVLLTSLFLVR
jgi:uncharacterized membrane protein